MKSDLTSRQQGAAKLLRCHCWQILYCYLFWKQFHPWRATWRHDNRVLPNFSVAISSYDLFRNHFHPWRATWRHDNRVLPNFSVAISSNYFTFIFPENNFIREERLDVTTTGCCQTSPLPFLAITLLLSFPKTISSVKSDLTSRQQGAAKLLHCSFWQLFTFNFSENNFIREERLDVTTTGCCQTSPLPLLAITLLLSFPKTISSVKSDLTSRQLGAVSFLRCHFWQLLYFYLFRKQFHPWRATWRHDNWVLPNFFVAFSGNYFTFIFSENNFIREERLDVTTTGCCQISPLPFLALILLLSFPKTISSVKSDLTSRQLGAAKLLRCHFWQLLYFYLLRKQFHPWRVTWRHDNWDLPNFYVAISGYDIYQKQFRPWRTTWRHDNWVLLNFSVAISGYDLFRKQFHPWRATWRHDNWVLPDFYVAISGNYFTFIFAENNFIGEERLDVTTTGCCQTSPLPFLAITFFLSFPKTISSVKSDLTSRQQGAAKLLRCHFWQLLYFYLFRKQFHPWRATWRHDNRVLPNSSVAISGNYFTFIFSENNFIGEERLDVTSTGCCQTSPLPFLAITLLLTFPKTISYVKSDLTSRQQGAAKLLRCHCWQILYCYLLRKQFHPWRATWRHDNRVLPNFSVAISSYDLFRNHFHPWRATWRHDNRVLPNFSVAISGNYFTFILHENNFIREERLDVTTTGCCQTSALPFLAITLLLSFPKTISSVKRDLTSRQQGAAKLLAAISGIYFTFIFSENNFIREERLDVTTTGCWKTSTWPFLAITLLLSFPKTIFSVKSDLTSRQLGAVSFLRCHFWQLLYFYLFRK